MEYIQVRRTMYGTLGNFPRHTLSVDVYGGLRARADARSHKERNFLFPELFDRFPDPRVGMGARGWVGSRKNPQLMHFYITITYVGPFKSEIAIRSVR